MFRRLFLVTVAAVTVLFSLGIVSAQNCPPVAQLRKTAIAPIRHILFDNNAPLSQAKELEIDKLLRRRKVDPNSIDQEMSAAADELAERVRAAFQDDGYFKVEVSAKPVKLDQPSGEYDLQATVNRVGPQYRLGDLRFVNATYFPTQQLLEAFPMHRGDIFSRGKVAAGLERLRRLYGSQGFINFTAVPNTQISDDDATINLELNIDEGKPFRLGRVRILGLDPDTEGQVLGQIEMKPGDVYSPELLERSLAEVRNLPQHLTAHGGTEVHESDGLIDVVLDFHKPGCAAQPAVTE